MKFLFCPDCGDAKTIRYDKTVCECGNSWGLYTDEVKAVFGGKAIPFGIGNGLFKSAIRGDTPVFFGWVYHSNWYADRLRENVFYLEENGNERILKKQNR